MLLEILCNAHGDPEWPPPPPPPPGPRPPLPLEKLEYSLVKCCHWIHLSYMHPVTSQNQFHCTGLYLPFNEIGRLLPNKLPTSFCWETNLCYLERLMESFLPEMHRGPLELAAHRRCVLYVCLSLHKGPCLCHEQLSQPATDRLPGHPGKSCGAPMQSVSTDYTGVHYHAD